MLKIAMVMADFSGDEAEEPRRALSFHRSEERMNKVCAKLRMAMERKGVTTEKIDKIVQSISSFALYGFPESHAISFAILAYGSAYLKVHRAPEFYASLLNNQPMGFYSPATIVKDAQRHGVRMLPDRKSTRLNSSHLVISYAVFCLKKKKKKNSILLCCEGYTDVRLRRCPKSTASHMSSNRLKARRYARSGDGAPLPARQAAGRQAR